MNTRTTIDSRRKVGASVTPTRSLTPMPPSSLPKLIDGVPTSANETSHHTWNGQPMGHDFSQIPVNSDTTDPQSCPLALASLPACPFSGAFHTCPARIQTKLTISKLDDEYIPEADRITDLVMRSPEQRLWQRAEPKEEQETPKIGSLFSQIKPMLQRKKESEEPEKNEEEIQVTTAQERPEVVTQSEAEPDWISGGISKGGLKGYECNFPFTLVVKEIACNCNDLNFAQYKSGLYTMIGEGDRKVQVQACSKGGWCEDVPKITSKFYGATGPKSVKLFSKLLPLSCSMGTKGGVTYKFKDAPGYEKNLGSKYTFGEKKRKITGINWNVKMKHKLWCEDKEVYSVTFKLTGLKTKEKDARSISIEK